MVDNGTIECTKTAEGIAGEHNAFTLHVRHHSLGPVQHRDEMERERAASQSERVAVGHHDVVGRSRTIKALHHLHCLFVAYETDFGVFVFDESQ